MNRYRVAKLALAAIAAGAALSAGAETRKPIAELQDPFWEGFAISASYTDRQNEAHNNQFAQFAAGYSWNNGFSVLVSLPIQLTNDPPSLDGAQTPRIGGDLSGRIQVDGLFRFWGDAYDYIALDLGAGLPFQSDAAYQNSGAKSWFFPITLSGRWDRSWLALEPSLTDGLTFPATLVNAKGNPIYDDATNTVLGSLTCWFYPSQSLAPFVSYTEQFPSATEYGIGESVRAFVLSRTQTGRTRSVTTGFSIAPLGSGLVLTLQARYYLLYPNDSLSPLQFTGGLRWVF